MGGFKMKLSGVYLPIITPFYKEKVDFESYENLINYYINQDISGIIPLGTTGESPTITDYEYEEIIEKTVSYVNGRVPIFIGAGSNSTDKLIKLVKTLEKYKIDGILSVAPYYNRPSQQGIYEHFLKLSENTSLAIIIYNIPYRTGVNIENTTIHKLAEKKNIIGLKDCSGNINQTMDLLLNRPSNFSILTGEDILYYLTLTLGGDGGILASAHLNTKKYSHIYNLINSNNSSEALALWKDLHATIPLLFKETNPGPIKYILKKMNMIKSSETRLPITEISSILSNSLDSLDISNLT